MKYSELTPITRSFVEISSIIVGVGLGILAVGFVIALLSELLPSIVMIIGVPLVFAWAIIKLIKSRKK